MSKESKNKENAVKAIMGLPDIKAIKDIAISLSKHRKADIDEIINNFEKAEGFLNLGKAQNDS